MLNPTQRLEQISAELDGLDRSALDAIATLLEERAAAIQVLSQRMRYSSDPLPEADASRLRAALEAGGRLRQKLLLTRASLREEAGHLFRANLLLRSLNAPGNDPTRLDCRA